MTARPVLPSIPRPCLVFPLASSQTFFFCLFVLPCTRQDAAALVGKLNIEVFPSYSYLGPASRTSWSRFFSVLLLSRLNPGHAWFSYCLFSLIPQCHRFGRPDPSLVPPYLETSLRDLMYQKKDSFRRSLFPVPPSGVTLPSSALRLECSPSLVFGGLASFPFAQDFFFFMVCPSSLLVM